MYANLKRFGVKITVPFCFLYAFFKEGQEADNPSQVSAADDDTKTGISPRTFLIAVLLLLALAGTLAVPLVMATLAAVPH